MYLKPSCNIKHKVRNENFHFQSILILLLDFRQHDNKVLKSSSKYLISLEADQKLYHLARLEIRNVEYSDRGDYQITAKNTLGEAFAHAQLNLADDHGHPK